MIDTDPQIIIRDLVIDNWNAGNTSLANAPDISTGWFDYGHGGPQVTVSNVSELTVGGGNTGHSAGTGDGGAAQVRAGTVLVNGWSGTRDELRGAASGGGDINPKQMSFELAAEIHRIMQQQAAGTTDDAGDTQLNSVGADAVRAIPEPDGPEFVHRREVTVKYTYIETT